MAAPQTEKVLTCKEDIKAYLNGISDYAFRKFIKLGMPARFDGRDWWAHVDNIDEWFRRYTLVQVGDAVDQIPEE